jgi:hypothetical protein
MKMVKNTLIAAALMGCAASAFAAPAASTAPQGAQPPCPHMMAPKPAPLYSTSMQTQDPVAALESAVKNVPALEKGKKYEIRVEVKELPPPPPVPGAAPESPQG